MKKSYFLFQYRIVVLFFVMSSVLQAVDYSKRDEINKLFDQSQTSAARLLKQLDDVLDNKETLIQTLIQSNTSSLREKLKTLE